MTNENANVSDPFGSPQDTASRDIGDLVKRGILTKDAGGGRSTSYSLVV